MKTLISLIKKLPGIDAVKFAVIVLINKFVQMFKCPGIKEGVLIVRLDELGDFILWLDSAKEYRRIFPNKKITILVNEKWIDLARQLNYWDEVIGISTLRKFRFNVFYKIKILKFIRSRGFEIVVSPRYTPLFLMEPSIMATCGATHRIGYDWDHPSKGPDNWYTDLMPAQRGQLMEISRNANFVRWLAVAFDSVIDYESTFPKLDLEEPKNPSKFKDYIVLCPKSRVGLRDWPLEDFISVAYDIRQRTGWEIVVLGDHSFDVPLWGFDNLSGQTKLLTYVALIKGAKMVLCNESSSVHLAVAMNVPCVCVAGGGHYGRFWPHEAEYARPGMIEPRFVTHQMPCFQCGWECLYKSSPRPCIKNVTREQVLEAVNEIIARYKLA